jgi:hypothetical protein
MASVRALTHTAAVLSALKPLHPWTLNYLFLATESSFAIFLQINSMEKYFAKTSVKKSHVNSGM